jgi:hypothetical protein
MYSARVIVSVWLSIIDGIFLVSFHLVVWVFFHHLPKVEFVCDYPQINPTPFLRSLAFLPD